MSAHVYICNIILRMFSFPIYVIFRIPVTLVISYWGIKLFSLQLSFDTNSPVLLWFLNLYNCRVVSSPTTTARVIEFQYVNRIYIFHVIQFSYCVTSNQHTSCDLLNQPKPIVSLGMCIFYILSCRNEYI